MKPVAPPTSVYLMSLASIKMGVINCVSRSSFVPVVSGAPVVVIVVDGSDVDGHVSLVRSPGTNVSVAVCPIIEVKLFNNDLSFYSLPIGYSIIKPSSFSPCLSVSFLLNLPLNNVSYEANLEVNSSTDNYLFLFIWVPDRQSNYN